MIDLFTPKIPAQPHPSSYGEVALQKLPRLTRAIYTANVGEQAPIWNKEFVIKRWADHTVKDRLPTVEYRYLHLVADGTNVGVAENVITVGEAITVNLPGKYTWAKWTPEIVQGYISSPDGTRTAIRPQFVSTRDQAEEIMKDLGAVEIIERTFAGPFKLIYDMRETRRIWSVKLRGGGSKEGTWNNVGLLFKMKYRQGVGAPGEWIRTATEPNWVSKKSEAPDEYDLRPEVPIPIRALRDNETAKLGFGGIITIFKDGAGEGGGGTDPKTAELIADTNKRVKQMQRDLAPIMGTG